MSKKITLTIAMLCCSITAGILMPPQLLGDYIAALLLILTGIFVAILGTKH